MRTDSFSNWTDLLLVLLYSVNDDFQNASLLVLHSTNAAQNFIKTKKDSHLQFDSDIQAFIF